MAAIINKRDAALQAASPRVLTTPIDGFLNSGAPSNLPVIGSITTSASGVGTVDITLNWTYTQGAIQADEFILYYAEGVTNPTTSSPVLAKVVGLSRSITIPGVPIEKSYRVGIVASRLSAGGVVSTSIVNSWVRTGGTANITANIGGVSATTIANHPSLTGNVHGVTLAQISGDLDSIANGVTYFRTTANQVTGAGRAFGALDSSNDYIRSLVSTKMTVVGANPATGLTIDANGIRMYQSSALTVSIPVVGTPFFKGDITGGSNINITGSGIFNGVVTVDGLDFCGSFNSSLGTPNGLSAQSVAGVALMGSTTGAGGRGVYGISQSSSGFGVGVYGVSQSSSGSGVTAYNTAGGKGLDVIGSMAISSTTLVSNLNADMVDGFHASAFAKLAGGNTWTGGQFFSNDIDVNGWVQCNSFRIDQTPTTGTATATFPGNNKPGSSTTCQWVTINLNGVTKYIPVWG